MGADAPIESFMRQNWIINLTFSYFIARCNWKFKSYFTVQCDMEHNQYLYHSFIGHRDGMQMENEWMLSSIQFDWMKKFKAKANCSLF